MSGSRADLPLQTGGLVRIIGMLALALAGCLPSSPSSDTAEIEAPELDQVPVCAGGDVGAVPGHEAYRLLEVEYPGGRVENANWVWSPSAAVRIDVDLESFSETGLEQAFVVDALGRASHFWNSTAAGFNVLIGETDMACCADADDTDCDACDAPPGGASLHFAEEDANLRVAASTRSHYGDDPTTPPVEIGCLVASEVRFFPSGVASGGVAVNYRWVEEGADVEDVDPSDGWVDKPFYDTLVHEIGHVLGLGDQVDPSVACSVMGHFGGEECEGDFETPNALDTEAVRHVYRSRR